MKQHFRWLVFAYSAVASKAIPVFCNSFECFQFFAGLDVKRGRIYKRSMLLLSYKILLADFRNIKIKSLMTMNRLLVTIKLNIPLRNIT